MPRITISSEVAVLVAAGLLMVAGCRKEYGQEKLGPDSPVGRKVRAMIDAARRAGESKLDHTAARQVADKLTSVQSASAAAMLRDIVLAAKVELRKLDRFGENVYRASLRLTLPDEVKTVHALLVETDGELRWAGPN